jgi:hypothetical protein
MEAMRQGTNDQLRQQQFGMQQQMQQLQYAQHMEAMKKTQQQEQALNTFAQTLPPDKQAIFRANPSAFIQEMNKRYTVGNNLVGGGGETVFTAPETPKTGADATGVTRFLNGPNQGQIVPGFGTPKSPEGFTRGADGKLVIDPGYLSGKSQIAASGRTTIDNKQEFKQEGEESKTVGKFFGTQYADIQKAGFNAPATIGRANRLSQLLEGIQTGKLTPAQTEVQATLASFGIQVGKDLGNKQAAEALSNAMALELRNPAGGAGMPGAMSDSDRKFLQGMVPGLGTSPEGRKLMIETSKKLAERDQVVARMARDYRKKNGSLDEGFFNELEAYSNSSPMFGAAAPEAAKPRAYNPQTGRID